MGHVTVTVGNHVIRLQTRTMGKRAQAWVVALDKGADSGTQVVTLEHEGVSASGRHRATLVGGTTRQETGVTIMRTKATCPSSPGTDAGV